MRHLRKFNEDKEQQLDLAWEYIPILRAYFGDIIDEGYEISNIVPTIHGDGTVSLEFKLPYRSVNANLNGNPNGPERLRDDFDESVKIPLNRKSKLIEMLVDTLEHINSGPDFYLTRIMESTLSKFLIVVKIKS